MALIGHSHVAATRGPAAVELGPCGCYYSRVRADVAQLVERVLGKDEVTSSILVIGSRLPPEALRGLAAKKQNTCLHWL